MIAECLVVNRSLACLSQNVRLEPFPFCSDVWGPFPTMSAARRTASIVIHRSAGGCRGWLVRALIAALWACSPSAPEGAHELRSRRAELTRDLNVLLITLDTTRADRIGC
jgi:hypothetical protein